MGQVQQDEQTSGVVRAQSQKFHYVVLTVAGKHLPVVHTLSDFKTDVGHIASPYEIFWLRGVQLKSLFDISNRFCQLVLVEVDFREGEVRLVLFGVLGN